MNENCNIFFHKNSPRPPRGGDTPHPAHRGLWPLSTPPPGLNIRHWEAGDRAAVARSALYWQRRSMQFVVDQNDGRKLNTHFTNCLYCEVIVVTTA